MGEPNKRQGQISARIIQRAPQPGDREGLTGRSADEYGWHDAEAAEMTGTQGGEIAPERNVALRRPGAPQIMRRMPPLQHANRERLDLRDELCTPAERLPCD